MKTLSETHVKLLCHAAGLGEGEIVSDPRPFSAAEANLSLCQELESMGYLRRTGPIGTHSYETTDAGQKAARTHAFFNKLDCLMDLRIQEEAAVQASSRVGEATHVMVDRLRKDPSVVARAQKNLLQETIEVASDLRDSLGYARAFIPEEGDKEHMKRVSFVDQSLAKSDALLGDIRVQQSVVMLRKCLAVFEFYPPQPVAWSDPMGTYVAKRDEPSLFVRCEVLTDGRLAVLKSKMGLGLQDYAQKLATECDGLVIEVNASRWPSSSDCFEALRQHLAIGPDLEDDGSNAVEQDSDSN